MRLAFSGQAADLWRENESEQRITLLTTLACGGQGGEAQVLFMIKTVKRNVTLHAFGKG